MTTPLYLGKVPGMSDDKTSVWSNSAALQLAEALTAIDDVSVMKNFLRDVMTEKELIEIGSRLEAARMLEEGSTYADIVAKTKLSSRTVARISAWMQDGCSGYAAVLAQLHHDHMTPVRAG